MRKIRWGAAVAAALLVSIPVAAEAATPTAPTTSTSTAPAPSTSTAPAPSTSTSNTSTSAPSTSTSSTSPTAPKSASTSTSTQTTTTTPAPAGTSEAYALVLGSILALSHTKASASGSGTSSTADPLELGGNPPASQFGGTQNGPGNSGSALLDTGPSSQFRLALMPWTASNSQSADQSQSTADAMSDIVLLDLGDQTTSQSASVRVLQSKSHASWTPAASSGNSSADGAIIKAGGPSGLNIDLLHSESSSSGAGSSYLLSINGNTIGSSGQVNGQCAITIPSLLAINCLTSTGGVANTVTTSGADVLTATLGPGSPQALTGKLIDSNTQAGSAPPAVSAGNGAQTGAGNGAGTGSGSGAAPASSGALAFTGLDAGSLLALALALALGGAGLVWWARRTRVSVI